MLDHWASTSKRLPPNHRLKLTAALPKYLWHHSLAGRWETEDRRREADCEVVEDQMTEEIKRLNDVWIKAWFEKDAATVDTLMTPDYEYVGPNGQVMDRERILQIIHSPTYALTSGSRTEVRLVEISPDVFAVSYRWKGMGTYEGRLFNDDHRGTMLCTRRKGKWLVAYEQCSPIVR